MWFQLFEGVELTLGSVYSLAWRRCHRYHSGCVPAALKGPLHREPGLAEMAGGCRLAGLFLAFLGERRADVSHCLSALPLS